MDIISQISMLGLIVLAAVLGGIIGIEREFSADKAAGVRTHMFVAAASAALLVLGQVVVSYFGSAENMTALRADPIRIIQAIIVGVSFIGGGIIFKDSNNPVVRNLTTATSILVTTAVGIAVALQLYYLAIGMTLVLVIANLFLVQIEKKMHPREFD